MEAHIGIIQIEKNRLIVFEGQIDFLDCLHKMRQIDKKARGTGMRNHAEDAKVFKAFCDVNRLQILEMLRDGEKCACNLLEELEIGQSTLSHHMKILCDSGIVVRRREGKWTHYSISVEGRKRAEELLTVLATPNTELNQCRCGDEI